MGACKMQRIVSAFTFLEQYHKHAEFLSPIILVMGYETNMPKKSLSRHLPEILWQLNYWVMHPVAHVSINIYGNLRTQQMSVLVLLCTSYNTCFGPYWWPSSGGFVTQKNSKAVTICQRIRCVSMLICKLDINI
jgi:hypothetical protein